MSHYYLVGIDCLRVESNFHTCAFFWVFQNNSTNKFCSFLHNFNTSCCTLFWPCTVPGISVYCNALNTNHFYSLLVQLTTFGFEHISCLRTLKLPPCWFQNLTHGSTLCSPAFSTFFEQGKSSLQTHTKSTYTIFAFLKSLPKLPTTQRSMEYLLRL